MLSYLKAFVTRWKKFKEAFYGETLIKLAGLIWWGEMFVVFQRMRVA
jgi:hypothetical protein